jgi:hypothetical protein
VSPEQGQRPELLADRYACTPGRGDFAGARAWHLGYLILAAGRGSYPAPAVTAGGAARKAGAPAVAARSSLPR